MMYVPFWQLILLALQFTLLDRTLQNSFWLYAIDYCLLDGVLGEVLFPQQVICDIDCGWKDGVNRNEVSCMLYRNKDYQGNIPQS